MEERVNRKILAQISKLYYLGGFSQNEIANLFGVSRSKVSRLLTLSKRMKVVDFSVSEVPFMNEEMAESIRTRYHLKYVRVVPFDILPDVTLRNAVTEAGGYFNTLLCAGARVGLSGGEAVAEFVREYSAENKVYDCTVIQLVGNTGKEIKETDNRALVKEAARKLSAAVQVIDAPTITVSENVSDILMKENFACVDFFSDIDIAICDIGDLRIERYKNAAQTWLSVSEIEEMIKCGFTTTFCGHYIGMTETGFSENKALCGRTIAIPLEMIRRTADVIAIAVGKEKLDSILNMMHSGYINALITDEITAMMLCSTADDKARRNDNLIK